MADIWIVSLFEPTPVDNTRPMRYMGIADAAIKAGHRITHFSCTFRHSTKVQRFEQNHEVQVRDNYELVFVHARRYQKNVSMERLRSHADFTRNLKGILEGRRKPDAVLVALPPLSHARYLTEWGKANNVPVIVDIIDPWPDVFLRLFPAALKPVARAAFAPMYRQLDQILNRCSGVISISEQYVDWAKGYHKDIPYTGVFYPSVPFKEVQEKIAAAAAKETRKDNRLTLVYAGNLGIAYDIPAILRAAELVEQQRPGRTSFVFAGAGHHKPAIEEQAKRQGNISFLGRIGYDDLMANYAKADIGIAQYSKGATQSVTYKLFDYLSAGLPVLNSLMSEMAVIIDKHDVGMNNDPGNAEQLAAGIMRYLDEPGLLERQRRNALELTAKEGDNDVVYARIVDFLLASRKKASLTIA